MSKPKEMPFLDHLEELRWRLIRSALALVVGSVIGVFATIRFDLIGVLTAPLFSVVEGLGRTDPSFLGVLGTERLVFLNLTEPFFFILRLGVMAGVVLASPVVVYQAWAFLAPALEDRERRAIVPTLTLGLALFSGGVAMAYFLALPLTIRFLLQFGSEWFTPALTAGFYMSLVVRLLLAFGLAFELPVVLLILTFLGLVSAHFLRAKRRYAVLVITVLAAFVSPGDAVVVTILLMAPLLVLYELGIVLSAAVERRRGDDAVAGSGPPDDGAPLLGALALTTYALRSRGGWPTSPLGTPSPGGA